MEFFIQLSGIIVGMLFPIFLINAIKTENKEKATNFTALSSISLGYVIFALICSIG